MWACPRHYAAGKEPISATSADMTNHGVLPSVNQRLAHDDRNARVGAGQRDNAPPRSEDYFVGSRCRRCLVAGIAVYLVGHVARYHRVDGGGPTVGIARQRCLSDPDRSTAVRFDSPTLLALTERDIMRLAFPSWHRSSEAVIGDHAVGHCGGDRELNADPDGIVVRLGRLKVAVTVPLSVVFLTQNR